MGAFFITHFWEMYFKFDPHIPLDLFLWVEHALSRNNLLCVWGGMVGFYPELPILMHTCITMMMMVMLFISTSCIYVNVLMQSIYIRKHRYIDLHCVRSSMVSVDMELPLYVNILMMIMLFICKFMYTNIYMFIRKFMYILQQIFCRVTFICIKL